MIKIHAFLMVIVLWIIPVLSPDKHNEQDSIVEKRSAFFTSYMKETFPNFKLTDGEYLFILPSGCFKCTHTVHDFLLSHPETIRGKYKAVLISQATVEKLSDKILTIDKHVLCDTTNKLDRMSFGISGVSVLKIKKQKIVASKSITVEEVRNDPEKFFKKL